MLSRILRQAILAVTLGAFLAAGILQATPSAQATAPAMTMNMGQDSGDAPMPCKDKMPGCMMDLGCVLILGVPAVPVAATRADVQWLRVTYLTVSLSASGRAIAPDIGPPIPSV